MAVKPKSEIEIISESLSSYGNFPNNDLPLLIYRSVFKDGVAADSFEKLFHSHNWKNSWRNGIYSYHHYHSITHEVLGIYSGAADVQLGGPEGIKVKVTAGDVIVIPAGVAHKNLGSSSDFACVGAYPDGKSYDMNYGKEGERPAADKNIANVELPANDPVYGAEGPIVEIWNSRKSSII